MVGTQRRDDMVHGVKRLKSNSTPQYISSKANNRGLINSRLIIISFPLKISYVSNDNISQKAKLASRYFYDENRRFEAY